MSRIAAGMTQMGSGDPRTVSWFQDNYDYFDLLRLQQEDKIRKYDETDTLKGWIALIAIILLIILIIWYIRKRL